jgi:hypothetical protein
LKPARQRQAARLPGGKLPKKRENGEYRQIQQTSTILTLLATEGPQTAEILASELSLHARTLDRMMRAMARSWPIHIRTVPGSGNPPSWSLDKEALRVKFWPEEQAKAPRR